MPDKRRASRVCTVLICIQICRTVPSLPPFTKGTVSGGGSGDGESGTGGSGGGSGGSGTGGGTGSTPLPYSYLADATQLTNADIDGLHWQRTTGSTTDGRDRETIANAPLDGGLGQFVSAAGKQRVLAERENYLRSVVGGSWWGYATDDLETQTTFFTFERIPGYELPNGYTMLSGSDGLDGNYPDTATKTEYRNWTDIGDGLTSGRLLDDPTNQTIILGGMIASAPAWYLVGAAGSGAVDLLFASEIEVEQGLTASQQVVAAAAIPGATLSSLVQTTTNAIASTNKLSSSQVAALSTLMAKVEVFLERQPRDFQISVLQHIAEVRYDLLEDMFGADPERYVQMLTTVARMVEEVPIRQVVDTVVQIDDLMNEDLKATALRTLSESSVKL